MLSSIPGILVVDDDPIFREIAVALLSPDALVRTAVDGQQAFELLQAWRPDLVITDIVMPGRDGIELIGDIHARWPDVAVIAVSSGSTSVGPDLYLQTATLLGVRAVARKPIAPAAFRALVRGILDSGPHDPVSVAAQLDRTSGAGTQLS